MKMRKHLFILFLAVCLVMPAMFTMNAGITIYADENYDAIPEGTYILTNKESGKVLDVYGKNNSSNNKANVQVYTKQTETALSQQFQVEKTSYGWYNLIPSSNTKLAVNAYSDTPKSGTNVNVYTVTNDSTQGWYFERVGNYYVIRCAYNKNIVMTETGTEDLSSVKLATYKSGKDSQLWTLELLDGCEVGIVSGMSYILINKESGKVLDVYGKNNSSNNKANVQVYTRLSGTCKSQQFQIVEMPEGWFKLIPQSNTKLLVNAYSDTPRNGTNINVYTAINNSTQGWYFEKAGNYYVIRCAYNNNVVMTETGTEDLSNVKLATYESGKDSQLWKLELVDEKISVDVSPYNVLVIDWSKIAEVGNQARKSYACSCFSLAYCRTILDGEVHQWYEYNKNRSNDQLDVSAQWSVGSYSMKYATDKNEVFKKAYDSINEGRPLIFYVTSKLGQHYVAVVGYTDVTNLDSLSESNFLIIDTVYGCTKSQVTNLADKGYKLRTLNGKYSYIITNKGGVDTYLSTMAASSAGIIANNLGLVNFFKQDTNTCKATAAALAVNLIMGQNTKTTASMISSGVLCANMNGNIYIGSDGNTYKTTYKTDGYIGSFDEEQAAINEAVSNGLPIVIAVHSTKSKGTKHHWVLVVGKQGDDYLVVDPARNGSGTIEDNVHTMSSLNYALGLTDYSTPHYGYISFISQ